MIVDYFLIALDGLKDRKLRSWLTMIGIFIGIATIVALIALGQGLQNVIFSQFSFLKTDVITVTGSASGNDFAASSNPLGEDELELLEKVRGVKYVSPSVMKPGQFKYKDYTGFAMISGTPMGKYREADKEMTTIDIEDGRDLRDSDKSSVILGHNIAYDDNLAKPMKVGDRITVEGNDFEVIGIYEKAGSFFADNSLSMNLDTLVDIFELNENEFASISVKVARGYDVNEVADEVMIRMRKHRDVKVDEEDFAVSTVQEQLDQMKSALFAVQLFLYIIAGISILVGGIGIMNTMFTSVLERTKQIGIMKAIGARNSTIFTLFFFESGILGMVGGLIGILFGSGLALLAQFVGKVALGSELISAAISPQLLLGALAFSFIIGSLSGIIPAMKAAKLHPVQALRGVN